jgi:hypothetical protein
VCWIHNRKWQHKTGACTFRLEEGWRTLFGIAGFEILSERPLSRWRNLAHPVSRRFFVLKANGAETHHALPHAELVAQDMFELAS